MVVYFAILGVKMTFVAKLNTKLMDESPKGYQDRKIFAQAMSVLQVFSKYGKVASATISFLGLLMSIGFETLQIFVIHAICMYCAISAATTLLLFGLAVWHWRTTRILA